LTQHVPAGDLDPLFVFDYRYIDEPDPHDSDRRPTTYWDVERGCRGPQPLPDWVVTDRGAVDVELGVLKTGKEADVFLVRRESTDDSGAEVVMAAKRYRDDRHRSFHRSTAYTENRRAKKSRDTRAVTRRSAYGRAVAAGMWADAEWSALCRYWAAGIPVPYPVQVDGTEILMEFIGHDGQAAPRLAQTRPEPDLLGHYFEQVRAAMVLLAGQGVTHGDLSPYNVLADDERLVLIDLPQVVDLAANPQGMEFLLRDCENICSWFTARGLDVDAQELFGELVSFAV
jgi:RIO kinase 1